MKGNLYVIKEKINYLPSHNQRSFLRWLCDITDSYAFPYPLP